MMCLQLVTLTQSDQKKLLVRAMSWLKELSFDLKTTDKTIFSKITWTDEQNKQIKTECSFDVT